MYPFVYFPVVVFNESLSAETTEKAVIFQMLPLVSISMTLDVKSFSTKGANEPLIFSLTNPVRGGEVSYEVGCIVIYRVDNLLADLADTHGSPGVCQVLNKVLPDRASLLPSLFRLFGLLQLSFTLGLLIFMRGG